MRTANEGKTLEMASLLSRTDSFDDEDEVYELQDSSSAPNAERRDSVDYIKGAVYAILLVLPWILFGVVETKREVAVSQLSQMNNSSVSEVNNGANTKSGKAIIDEPLEAEHSTFTEVDYFIHTIYDDLHYRRVCAPVHSSHLCLTIRYPFPIQPKAQGVNYAKPVEERFYDNPVEVHFIDGEDLLACKMQNGTMSEQPVIKACIDQYKSDDQATALWSRHRDGNMTLYGIDSEGQRQRVHQYFESTVVLVLGASPSPPITETLKQLFHSCQRVDKWNGLGTLQPFKGLKSLKKGQSLCMPEAWDARATDWQYLNKRNDWTMLLHDSFYPQDHGHKIYNHSIADGLTVAREMEKIQTFSKLKEVNFTILIEHPIAHMQNQDLMQKSYEYIAGLQNKWTQVFLNATKGEQREALAKKGLNFNLIGFDGSPQFFPTESGGHLGLLKTFANEEDFLEKGGYEGWQSDFGSRCRGFLSPSGNLTKFNDLGRKFYKQNGLDMRWYGRTWEFINLVWFTVKGTQGWGNKGIDCTHGGGSGAAISNMHKYFVMAMIDDHFDDATSERM